MKKPGKNASKSKGASNREGISLMLRAARIYREQAQTGHIDRAYHMYSADLETSLENLLDTFPRKTEPSPTLLP